MPDYDAFTTALRKCLFAAATVIAALLLFSSCDAFEDKKQAKGPQGYDLSRPRVIRLPLELDEISGLSYWPGDSSLLAINDEQGYLYKISVHNPSDIRRWKFSGGHDYEDVAILDSTFFVLRSNGDIVAFRFADDGDSLSERKIPFTRSSGNEFESICAFPEQNGLLLVCKSCKQDNKKKISTFWLDGATYELSESMTITTEKIAELEGKKAVRFKPSAVAVSPVDHRLYFIAAVNKKLAIADSNRITDVYELDPGLFKQPEGMTFAPDGTLFISNEAAGVGVAEILIFPYQQARRR